LHQGIYQLFDITTGRLFQGLRGEEMFQSMVRIVQSDNDRGVAAVHQRSKLVGRESVPPGVHAIQIDRGSIDGDHRNASLYQNSKGSDVNRSEPIPRHSDVCGLCGEILPLSTERVKRPRGPPRPVSW
jgi:hypothetical protein